MNRGKGLTYPLFSSEGKYFSRRDIDDSWMFRTGSTYSRDLYRHKETYVMTTHTKRQILVAWFYVVSTFHGIFRNLTTQIFHSGDLGTLGLGTEVLTDFHHRYSQTSSGDRDKVRYLVFCHTIFVRTQYMTSRYSSM